MRPLLLLLALALAAGCLGADAPAPDAPREDVQTDAAGLRPITARFTGSALGTPVSPDVQEFRFDVPSGAVGVNGTLAWDSPAARFDLVLLDPRGDVAAEGYRDASGALVVATVDPPRPGAWVYRVVAETALNVPFTLEVAADLIVPEHNVIDKRMTLGQRGFYEVNLILEGNASFAFSFNSSQPLRWDIHSHPPEGLKIWQEGEAASASVAFTAPARGVYSILWENTAPLPAELAFRVDGRFRVHSHAG